MNPRPSSAPLLSLAAAMTVSSCAMLGLAGSTAQGTHARDVFFAPSATAMWRYTMETRTQTATESFTSTGSMEVQVLALADSGDKAQVRFTTYPADGATQSVNGTWTVQASGSVLQQLALQGEPSTIYDDAVLSSAGAVTQYLGDQIAQRMEWDASESVTVPAGSYAAYRLRVKNILPDQPNDTIWAAPGVGIVKQVENRTSANNVSKVTTLELETFSR